MFDAPGGLCYYSQAPGPKLDVFCCEYRCFRARELSISTNYRINRQIRAREVRLIDHENKNRGVVSLREAQDIANEAELDLVEVAPNSVPPVCRVMDFSKFSYEKKKQQRDARKKQKTVEIKAIRLKVKTSGFHMDLDMKRARTWIEEGKKVRVQVRFIAREISYPELGEAMLRRFAEGVSDITVLEEPPTLQGWTMTMTLAPKTD
ncbi:MAG: translation initiation factor IF-3 [Chloroflexi bacterium]|nr:translation initiation factor IF-3 [Chloroflexota bacterium]MBP8058906.1 translation initiation factor IF-3 [Chloroflexota bacterium]